MFTLIIIIGISVLLMAFRPTEEDFVEWYVERNHTNLGSFFDEAFELVVKARTKTQDYLIFSVFRVDGKDYYVERIKLIINIESQKDFYPGYPIISRGIYYGARMVSAQNGVEFREPDYGDIKKVYSIWICMGAPKYIGNALSIYEIHKTDVIGKIPVSYPGCKNKKADSSGRI